MRKMILILMAVAVTIFSFLVIVKFVLNKDVVYKDPGYQRYQTCKQINNKIEKRELMRLLAEPYETEKEQRGVVYYYHEAMFAAGPIRILLDNQEAMVIGVKCSEDGEWKIFKS